MKSFLKSISQFQVESRNPIQSLFNSHSQSDYNSHSHVLSLSSSFKSEVFQWINHWKRQLASDKYISVSSLLAKSADNIFFPNGRQLLKILVILLMGSTDVNTRTIKLNERISWWPIGISHPPFKNPRSTSVIFVYR